MTLETQIRDILGSEFGLQTDQLGDDAAIFSSGQLDSLSSLRLLMSLEGHFQLSISPLDITLEDIDSIEKISETIRRLQG